MLARQLICYGQELLTSSLPLTGECSTFWHKVVFKSIRENDIDRLVQQLLTFTGCNLTHSSKAIDIFSCLVLYRVLALHVKLISHLVTIVTLKIVIQWFVVTGYTSANTRGMSCEYSSDLRNVFMDIQQAKTRHPFISMINNLLFRGDIIIVETLYNQGCSIGEH